MKHAPDWILVGMVKRIHGQAGEMLIMPLTDNPERFRTGVELSLTRKRNDEHETVRITASRMSHLGPLIKLEGFDTREEAMELFGASLFIAAAELAPPQADSYYPFQLEGCEVFAGEERIGEVMRLYESRQANPYLEVDPGGEAKPVFIPFVKAVVMSVDMERRRLDIIEGFLG